MAVTGHEPTMTIGSVVAELRASFPEVTHSSLRFLEREGLVAPARTPGGHRLYTRSDLERIRQIKRWQARRFSLEEIRDRLELRGPANHHARIASRFLEQALEGKPAEALQTVLHRDELGVPMTELFDGVLGPVLRDLARRRSNGEISYGQEHETAGLVEDLVGDLGVRHTTPAPGRPVVVAACVEGEMHDLGLRMVTAALRERGAKVHSLGANVDAEPLIGTCRDRAPDLVLLSVTTTALVPVLISTVEALRAMRGDASRPVIIAGGTACTGRMRPYIPADIVMPPDLPLETVASRILEAVPAHRH